MTKTQPSREQILEAAMCAWEEIFLKTSTDASELSPIWIRMTSLRKVIGTPTMRYHTGQIANAITEAFKIAEREAGGFYDDPFDWEFVPDFLARSLDVCEETNSFNLIDSWREHAAVLGANLSSARRQVTRDATLTDRELFLLGTVRNLLLGCSFEDAAIPTELSAIIVDALKNCAADEIDCEEFRALAPGAFANSGEVRANYSLDRRELATILASMRRRQQDMNSMSADNMEPFEEIANRAGEFDALTTEEINTLCERLNCTPTHGEGK